jgi:predicted DNA-binding ribbon-helix-helix protein
MRKKGGKRDNAGRKRKETGLIKPVSVGMTDEMYTMLNQIAKTRKTSFQKIMREIATRFIEENIAALRGVNQHLGVIPHRT